MSEARVALLFNKWDGDNGPHPHQDRLIGMSNILADLDARGVAIDVLYGEQAPQPGNVQPRVGVSRNFSYDPKDKFVHAESRWEDYPGDLGDYDLIIDQGYRWIHRTPDLSRPDHYVSPGIGVLTSHAINSYLVHAFGNDKTLAHNKLLVPNAAGLATYTIDQLETLEGEWHDIPFYAKPVSGSCGRDIETPNNLRELHQMVREGRITSDYQIQPRIDETLPIGNLVAYHSKDQADLDRYNTDRDYVKERRHHVFTTEIEGTVETRLFSTLRVGQQGAQRMGQANSKWIALSPESLPESNDWHKTLNGVAQSLHSEVAASADGTPTHFMIAIDDADAGFPDGQQRPVVIEVNTRFAGLAKEAVLAQKAFPEFIARIALSNAASRS